MTTSQPNSLLQALDESAAFQCRLKSVKESLAVDFPWYPYESLSNLTHLSALLRKLDGDLFDWLPNRSLMDIGCADGELSLLFESLGFSVDAIDHAPSNHNRLEGARALIQATGSGVRLHDLDLDGGGELPAPEAGLVLCLGLLYHLKNPFLFLERLARHSHYCLLSTKLLTHLPGISNSMDAQPLAYLLDSSELNNDDSNFWLFTGAALSRLLHRSGWRVLASLELEADADRRVFMALGSRAGLRSIRLLNGWYGREETGWRWTAPAFSFLIPAVAGAAQELCLETYIPPELNGSRSLRTLIEGEFAADCPLDGEEFHTLRIPVPGHLRSRSSLSVECVLSSPVRWGADKRDLGLLLGDIYCSGAPAR